MTKVKMQLVGLDGNAFSLMGAFKSAARKQGWDRTAIDAVIEECMTGDYNHLLCTLMDNIDSDEDDGEEAGHQPRVGDMCMAATMAEDEYEHGRITRIDGDQVYADLNVGGGWEFSGDMPTRKEEGVWVFDSF